MSKFILHYYPRTCALVTLNAMVEAGMECELSYVNIMAGDQKKPEYLKIHPGGKVPALQVGDRVLTENAAIVTYIDNLAPDAGLFPKTDDPLKKAQHTSDLIWCSATFHPAIRQVRMPIRFTDGDPSGVRAKGMEYATAMFAQVEERVSGDRWWYGDTWSIVDVYVNWCVMTAISGEPSLLEPCPGIRSHIERVHTRPSYQKAMEANLKLEREKEVVFPT